MTCFVFVEEIEAESLGRGGREKKTKEKSTKAQEMSLIGSSKKSFIIG